MALAASLVQAQQYQRAWVATIHPGPKVDSLGRKSLAVDANGYAYVVDQLVAGDKDSYVTIQKFDPSGNNISTFFYPPYYPPYIPNGEHWGVAVALDNPTGPNYVYVAGVTGTPCCGRDIQVVKFNATTGAVVWAVTMGGDANADDSPVAIEIAPGSLDPIILGTVVNNVTGPDIATYRLSAATGGIVWPTMYNRAGMNKTDTAVDLTVYGIGQSSGQTLLEIYVAGISFGGTLDIVVLKYIDQGTGQPVDAWGGPSIFDDGLGNSTCSAMVVSPAASGAEANVYVTGQTLPQGSSNQDIVTYALFKANGALHWQAPLFDGTSHKADYAKSIARGQSTASGTRLFVTGGATMLASSSVDWVVLAYDPETGYGAWQSGARIISVVQGALDEGVDVVSPNEDDLYVVGSSTSATGGLDVATTRLQWSTGSFVWQNAAPDINIARYDASGGFDAALAVKPVALPNCSSLWVLGKSASSGGGNDTVLIRYDQINCP